MEKNTFDLGDLVEIAETQTEFRAHIGNLKGKIGIVVGLPAGSSVLNIYRVLIDEQIQPVMEKHLRKPFSYEKGKHYEGYED